MIIEKMCPDDEDPFDDKDQQKIKPKHILYSIKVIGVLNMLANVVDNFTHGIAVAGSFQASHKVQFERFLCFPRFLLIESFCRSKFGMMTLVATLLHEVPHEIGDFVILLRSGLTYWQAALAQVNRVVSTIDVGVLRRFPMSTVRFLT
jgi:zinc transporter 13